MPTNKGLITMKATTATKVTKVSKVSKVSKATQSKTTDKSVNKLINLITTAKRGATTLTDFITADLEANKGQLVLLTAQHLYSGKKGSQCPNLNTLQILVKRISGNKDNNIEPVRISRVDRKTNECELYANDSAVKAFSTFDEIMKHLNRKEGKTQNNLDSGQAQKLVQYIGGLFS